MCFLHFSLLLVSYLFSSTSSAASNEAFPKSVYLACDTHAVTMQCSSSFLNECLNRSPNIDVHSCVRRVLTVHAPARDSFMSTISYHLNHRHELFHAQKEGFSMSLDVNSMIRVTTNGVFHETLSLPLLSSSSNPPLQLSLDLMLLQRCQYC